MEPQPGWQSWVNRGFPSWKLHFENPVQATGNTTEPHMNSFRQFVMTGVRVVMFSGSVIVLLAVLHAVLSHPMTRAALGVVLLFLAVGAILAAAGWTLRRMWTVSGQLASVIVPASSQIPKEEQA